MMGKFSKPKTSIGENSNYVKNHSKTTKERPSFKDDIQQLQMIGKYPKP